MMPTLVAGQFVLFEPGGRFEAGDVVLARHPTQGIDLVKRVISVESVGLVQLGSDNAEAGTDSRSFGRIDIDHVVGRVTISLEWPFPLVGRR